MAVAPGIGIALINDTSSASIGTGATLTIGGSLASGAAYTGSAPTSAGSAATAGKAAVGITLALALVDDQTVATTHRNLAAGGSVMFAAMATDGGSATATASAAGAPDNSTSQNNTVDSQVASERGVADGMAGGSALSSSSGDGATPSASAVNTAPSTASTTNGAGGSGTQVSVAAAIAVNLAKLTATASIPDGLTISAGGALVAAASQTSVSTASANGSATSQGSGGIGVGAAVAINLVKADAEGTIGQNAKIAAQGVTLKAVMNAPTYAETFGATAIAEAGAGKVGVAGAVALNLVSDTHAARVGGGTTLTLGTGAVMLVAASTASDTAMAAAKDTGAGSKVGVGASVALNILSDTVDAELSDSATMTGGGAMTVSSALTHTVVTDAEAGSSGNGVSVAPAIALAIVNDTTTARLGTGTALNLGGSLVDSAAHSGTITTTTGSAADAGGKAAVGVSIGVVIASDTTTAATARSLTSAGSVSFTSSDSNASDVTSTSSAQGISAGSSDTDSQISAQRDFADNKAATSDFQSVAPAPSTQKSEDKGSAASQTEGGGKENPAPSGGQTSSSGGTSKVGVAAGIGVNVVTVNNAATIGAGLTVKAGGGALTVAATNDSDATAKGLASSLLSQNAIGATVSLNIVYVTNTASVGASATVAGQGVTVDALTTAGKSDYFRARAYAAGAGTKNGIAGAVGLNIVAINDSATVGQGVNLTSGGNVDFSASTPVLAENVALGAGLSGGTAGAGAAVVVDVFNDTTQAQVGDGSMLNESGNLNVSAVASLNPITGQYPGDPLSIAVGVGATSGDDGIGGSVIVDLLTLNMFASIGRSVNVNQNVTPGMSQGVAINASGGFSIASLAGAIGLSGGSAGVGAGIDVAVVSEDTEASIGYLSNLKADQSVLLTSSSTDSDSTISAAGGAGNSVEVAGGLTIEVLSLTTKAFIDHTSTVAANGNVLVQAKHGLTINNIDGQISIGGEAGVGAAVSTVVDNTTTNAFVGSADQITASGNRGTTRRAGRDDRRQRQPDHEHPGRCRPRHGSGELHDVRRRRLGGRDGGRGGLGGRERPERDNDGPRRQWCAHRRDEQRRGLRPGRGRPGRERDDALQHGGLAVGRRDGRGGRRRGHRGDHQGHRGVDHKLQRDR